MLYIKNMFFLMKEKISSIKIYLSVLLFFLVTSMDGYTCDSDGHIKFHNHTDIPITVTLSRKEIHSNSKNKKIRFEEKIVPAKKTSGGTCWYSYDYGRLIYFKTSFKYKDEIVQGPQGEIHINVDDNPSYGKIKNHKGDQSLIVSSSCKRYYTICTVDLRITK